VRKEYTAVVHGQPPWPSDGEAIIDLPLRRATCCDRWIGAERRLMRPVCQEFI
jgi:hypothetical protein